jgi:hypothetical protein
VRSHERFLGEVLGATPVAREHPGQADDRAVLRAKNSANGSGAGTGNTVADASDNASTASWSRSHWTGDRLPSVLGDLVGDPPFCCSSHPPHPPGELFDNRTERACGRGRHVELVAKLGADQRSVLLLEVPIRREEVLHQRVVVVLVVDHGDPLYWI